MIHQLIGLSGLHDRSDIRQSVIEIRESLAADGEVSPEEKLCALEALVSGMKD